MLKMFVAWWIRGNSSKTYQGDCKTKVLRLSKRCFLESKAQTFYALFLFRVFYTVLYIWCAQICRLSHLTLSLTCSPLYQRLQLSWCWATLVQLCFVLIKWCSFHTATYTCYLALKKVSDLKLAIFSLHISVSRGSSTPHIQVSFFSAQKAQSLIHTTFLKLPVTQNTWQLKCQNVIHK